MAIKLPLAKTLTALVFGLWPIISCANTTNQMPHLHGEATAHFVLDGTTILLEIDSPAINFLGFEKQPTTDEEYIQLTDIINRLGTSENIIALDGGECSLTQKEIDFPYHLKSDANTDKMHTEHEHEHKHDEDEHGDINIRYQFSCNDIVTLKAVTFPLLTEFPGVTQLNVQWILPTGQGGQLLTAEDNIIKLK